MTATPEFGIGQARPATDGDIAAMAAVPLFAGLSRDHLLRLTAGAVIECRPEGETLFHQGEEPFFLHVLLEGQVGLMAVDESGAETAVEILTDGAHFIPAAVVTGRPYLMAALTLAPSRLLLVPRQTLQAELDADPEMARAMLSWLADDLGHMIDEVRDLKLKSAGQRLAHYLLTLTAKSQGSAILTLPHRKGMIARRIGVRPETLSRIFATLRGEGVALDGSAVAIADVGRLRRYCGRRDGA